MITVTCPNTGCAYVGLRSTFEPIRITERTVFCPTLNCAGCGYVMMPVFDAVEPFPAPTGPPVGSFVDEDLPAR